MIGGNLYELGLFLLAYVPDLAEAAGVKAAVRRGVDGDGHYAFQDDTRPTVFFVHYSQSNSAPFSS